MRLSAQSSRLVSATRPRLITAIRGGRSMLPRRDAGVALSVRGDPGTALSPRGDSVTPPSVFTDSDAAPSSCAAPGAPPSVSHNCPHARFEGSSTRQPAEKVGNSSTPKSGTSLYPDTSAIASIIAPGRSPSHCNASADKLCAYTLTPASSAAHARSDTSPVIKMSASPSSMRATSTVRHPHSHEAPAHRHPCHEDGMSTQIRPRG